MMDKTLRNQITQLVKSSIEPAVGCTEPVCVALVAARARELLEVRPEKVLVELSANIIKNAMGVGVPGTKEIGLPIAIALGILMGNSKDKLKLLENVTPEEVEASKKYINEKRIKIVESKTCASKLYVAITVYAQNEYAKAVLAYHHTNFVLLDKNGKLLKNEPLDQDVENTHADHIHLSLSKVYDYATTAPIEEIAFIGDTAKYNRLVAKKSLESKYGHGVGKIIQSSSADDLLADSVYRKMLISTAGACDARMSGASWPVMSNSGSGNQGICATNPVSVYAECHSCSEEQTIRALMLSHLVAIYIKTKLGALSALCGCVVAGIGSACGLTYLMGGNFSQVSYAVQNMVANVTGMLCDGAKPGCALKLSTGVSVAVMSALMAMHNECVASTEGIIDQDVEQTISNMVKIGSQAMNETDKCVLDIMTSKH